MDISRKRFVETATAGGALLLLGSCGGGGTGYSGGVAAGNAMPASSCTPDIAGNHGHVLAIAVADLDSGTDKTYNIQGGATHNHQVTFTVALLRQLKAGDAVTVTSTPGSADGHTHEVTVSCMLY